MRLSVNYTIIDDVIIRFTVKVFSITFFGHFLLLQDFFLMSTHQFFLKELLIEMTDSNGRGIISLVLSRAFS